MAVRKEVGCEEGGWNEAERGLEVDRWRSDGGCRAPGVSFGAVCRSCGRLSRSREAAGYIVTKKLDLHRIRTGLLSPEAVSVAPGVQCRWL